MVVELEGLIPIILAPYHGIALQLIHNPEIGKTKRCERSLKNAISGALIGAIRPSAIRKRSPYAAQRK